MSAEPLLLVVDDEAGILRLIKLELSAQGFRVITASGGEEALRLAEEQRPDAVLLDIMMPEITGLEVMRRLRERTNIPVLLVTAKDKDADKVRGLELGADDYIVKPFGYKELVTRVKAALSRARRARGEQTIFQTGNLWVNLDTHEVKVDNRLVSLTPTEFQLLSALIQDSGRTVNHDTLLRRVWGAEYSNRRDYLKLYIWYLRQKVEADPRNPKRIVSERGQGYRLVIETPEA